MGEEPKLQEGWAEGTIGRGVGFYLLVKVDSRLCMLCMHVGVHCRPGRWLGSLSARRRCLVEALWWNRGEQRALPRPSLAGHDGQDQETTEHAQHARVLVRGE